MAPSRATPLLGTLEKTGDDLVDHYQIRAHFQPYVEHHQYFSDPSRGLRHQLEIKQWKRVQELGRGGFGTVFLEQERGGDLRAVKEISKNASRAKTIDYLREVIAMVNLSKEDTFFVKIHGWFQNADYVFIAMEFARYGDLHKNVSEALPENEARIITSQVTEALDFLHAEDFTHRDLKPANVFVFSIAPHWFVKLGDFGVTKRVVDDRTLYRTSIGQPFSAPEIHEPDSQDPKEASAYTNAVDMWSLGCLAHWLMTLRLPWDSNHQYMHFYLGLQTLPVRHLSARSVSTDAMAFVENLIRSKAEQRLTAKAALDHSWLRDSAYLEHEAPLTPPLDLSETQGSPSLTDKGSMQSDKVTPINVVDNPNLTHSMSTELGELHSSIQKPSITNTDLLGDVVVHPVPNEARHSSAQEKHSPVPESPEQSGVHEDEGSRDDLKHVSDSSKSMAYQRWEDWVRKNPSLLPKKGTLRSMKPVDREAKLNHLRKFASNFRVNSPVPADLLPILTKDLYKQQELLLKSQKADANDIKSTSRAPQSPPSTNVGYSTTSSMAQVTHTPVDILNESSYAPRYEQGRRLTSVTASEVLTDGDRSKGRMSWAQVVGSGVSQPNNLIDPKTSVSTKSTSADSLATPRKPAKKSRNERRKAAEAKQANNVLH